MKRKLDGHDEEYDLVGSVYHYEEDGCEEDEFRHSGLLMDDRFYTVLHHAAERGDAEWCKEILLGHPGAVTDANGQGHMPLDLAAIRGHFKVCEILLAYMETKDIYAERADGHTTLSLILMEENITDDHCKIFGMLLDGVPHSITPIDDVAVSIITNHYDSPRIVIVNFKNLLYLAAAKGSRQICEIILKNTPSAAQEVSGQLDSPIRVAAASGFPEIVDLLISNMRLKDIATIIHREKGLISPSKTTVQSTALLKAVCDLVSDYIVKQNPQDKAVITSETNFREHFTWLKIYQILSLEASSKTYLSAVSENHQQLLFSVEKYFAAIFFKFIGVCKNIAKEYPFSLLSNDCIGNIIHIVKKICYPTLDFSPTTEQVESVDISYAGQDSDLN